MLLVGALVNCGYNTNTTHRGDCLYNNRYEDHLSGCKFHITPRDEGVYEEGYSAVND